MPEVMKACDVNQGFNFTQDVQSTVGHLNSLKIGSDLTLVETFNVGNPEDAKGAAVKVAGVVSSIYWGGEKTSEIQITAQVSNDNRNKLQTTLLSGLKDVAVEFAFTIYEYDLGKGSQQYFKSFHTNAVKLKGSIQKIGTDLQIAIGDQPDPMVQQPLNYTMTISIVPEAEEMALHIAASVESKIACQWGVAEA